MLAELSRYLYLHWSANGMKHLCCWKPPLRSRPRSAHVLARHTSRGARRWVRCVDGDARRTTACRA
eukprot:6711989-Prymnesium_polylepis.1